MADINELSVALLRAAGIPSDDACGVEYRHRIGEIPELLVTFSVWNVDEKEFDEVTQRFVAVPPEAPDGDVA